MPIDLAAAAAGPSFYGSGWPLVIAVIALILVRLFMPSGKSGAEG